MTLTTMYPAKVNSPELVLTTDITADAAVIAVTGDITKLPTAPNIFVIGTGEDCETVYYPTAADAGVFSGVTREFNKDATHGLKKAWTAGTAVSRLFTAYDYDTLRTNIILHDSPQASIMLMPGGSFVPDVDYPTWDQAQTTTNKNCYMYLGYSYTALNRANWTVPVPLGFTSGTNMTATFYWTSASASSGNVKWDLYAYRPADDVSLDTVTVEVATKTDAHAGVADIMHATTESAAFAITGTGRFIFFEVRRDWEDVTDTLNDTARLLGVEVKYVRTQNY